MRETCDSCLATGVLWSAGPAVVPDWAAEHADHLSKEPGRVYVPGLDERFGNGALRFGDLDYARQWAEHTGWDGQRYVRVVAGVEWVELSQGEDWVRCVFDSGFDVFARADMLSHRGECDSETCISVFERARAARRIFPDGDILRVDLPHTPIGVESALIERLTVVESNPDSCDKCTLGEFWSKQFVLPTKRAATLLSVRVDEWPDDEYDAATRYPW